MDKDLDPRDKDNYPDLYQWRMKNQWMAYPKDDCESFMKVISYFCPKLPRQPFDVTDTFIAPVVDFEIKMDTKVAISQLQDRMFLKKKTRSKSGKLQRMTLSKEMLELPEWEVYHSPLYCITCVRRLQRVLRRCCYQNKSGVDFSLLYLRRCRSSVKLVKC